MPVLDTGIQGRKRLSVVLWIAGSNPAMTPLGLAAAHNDGGRANGGDGTGGIGEGICRLFH
jgi:hypothetical protein